MTPAEHRQRWEDALDQLEERLRRQEELVAGGRGEIPGELVADAEGPMPVEFRSRAVALLERTNRLMDSAQEKLAASVAPRAASYGSYGEAGGLDHGAL